MKTVLPLLVGVLLWSGSPQASDLRPIGIGIDTELPFQLQQDGQNVRGRQNLNVGVDGRYWWNDEIANVLRFSFDAEKRDGTLRKIGLEPGIERHFMPGENWRPYIRLDAPALLRGAPSISGASDKMDIAISGGGGFVWKLGDAIGWPGMEFRYDFDIYYFFGAGSAVSQLGMDLFRFGLDARF
ncbi:MAG: hypothetical protein V1798_11010 [Pseudomonadota bacterium]